MVTEGGGMFRTSSALWMIGSVGCFLCCTPQSAFAQGLIVSSAGPVNRSMGGAATAAPIDALGAIYWNPATISGLERSETSFGLDLLLVNHSVTSSFGPFQGETEADPGIFPIPNVGWVHRTDVPEITLGLGVNGLAGFKTNLPASNTNPALFPQPLGLGNVTSEASFLQIAPVISIQLTKRLAVAAGPTITSGQVTLEPFVFDTPNANQMYASGRASRYHWGAGLQVGAYYLVDEDWQLGAALKSKTWMEDFEFFGMDANGFARTMTTEIELPMMLSLGMAYRGWERWLFALDVRYIDFADTDGLGESGTFDANGRLRGLGWSSVMAVAFGTQYQWSDRLALRCGYTFNQNPIQDNEAFINIASPLIYEHTLSTGLSLQATRSLSFNVGYSYLVENSLTGLLVSPTLGPIPGSSFTNTMDAHFFSFGITVKQ